VNSDSAVTATPADGFNGTLVAAVRNSDAADCAAPAPSGICVLALNVRVAVDVATDAWNPITPGPAVTVRVAEDCPVAVPSGMYVCAVKATVAEDWPAAAPSAITVGAFRASVAAETAAAVPNGTRVGANNANAAVETAAAAPNGI
jgi:hypothetical protein